MVVLGLVALGMVILGLVFLGMVQVPFIHTFIQPYALHTFILRVDILAAVGYFKLQNKTTPVVISFMKIIFGTPGICFCFLDKAISAVEERMGSAL